jgi:hypothetical protein
MVLFVPHTIQCCSANPRRVSLHLCLLGLVVAYQISLRLFGAVSQQQDWPAVCALKVTS